MADIRIQGLEAGYGEWPVLDGLSLEAEAGAIVGIVGPNGAGKTTLLNAIAGRVPPMAGTIEVGGRAWLGLPVHARVKDGLAYVPEHRGLAGRLTVEETFRVVAASDDARRIVERTYELFPNLATRRDVESHNLSGGEQQMLAIARALTLRPRLLLLDEPTLGLAPMMVGIVRQFIGEAGKQGTTILIAEQNLRFVEEVATEVRLLARGRLERVDPSTLASVDDLFAVESTIETPPLS